VDRTTRRVSYGTDFQIWVITNLDLSEILLEQLTVGTSRNNSYPLSFATTSKGRIISLAACSSRWQCHT
jgi:hypothetical protein